MENNTNYTLIKNHLLRIKFNGIEKSFYPSGQLKIETPYRDGKHHGLQRIYFPSGKLKEEASYVDGKLNGFCRCYNELGLPICDGYFYNDILQGHVTSYDSKGYIKSYLKNK